jgi:NADPH:quinone reductase-like Zn-dependent oxidoreductase
MSMHAAVVRSFDEPPHYETWDTPTATGPNEAIVDVLAAGLHPRVRTDAAGRHYTSTGVLPMIPGIDGVGRLDDGRRVYFVAPDDVLGSMADRTVVDLRRTVPLPENVDPVKVAAALNPAMSSWVALRRRVPLKSGQAVLVLGATGNAGAMAIQVAKHLGAGRVIGAGRNPQRLVELTALGADEVVELSGEASAGLARAAAEVDVVIDYLWSEPAATAMMAILKAREDRCRRLEWIQIGAMAGPTIELPSVALRSVNLGIQGNGQGAVSAEIYLAELPSLINEIDRETFEIEVRPVSLAEVEDVWIRPDPAGLRTVFIP